MSGVRSPHASPIGSLRRRASKRPRSRPGLEAARGTRSDSQPNGGVAGGPRLRLRGEGCSSLTDGAGELGSACFMTRIDLNTESELNAMAPETVSIHAARVPVARRLDKRRGPGSAWPGPSACSRGTTEDEPSCSRSRRAAMLRLTGDTLRLRSISRRFCATQRPA